MNLVLSAETEKLLQERMNEGGYGTPEEVVRAGLEYLKQQERFGHFEPGEMEQLIAVAMLRSSVAKSLMASKCLTRSVN